MFSFMGQQTTVRHTNSLMHTSFLLFLEITKEHVTSQQFSISPVGKREQTFLMAPTDFVVLF